MSFRRVSYFVFFLFLIQLCSSMTRWKLNKKRENRQEIRYPNGTIVGKYVYKVKDGNPINVRYFADDSSYGVELRSIKIYGSNSELLPQGKEECKNLSTDAPETFSYNDFVSNRHKNASELKSNVGEDREEVEINSKKSNVANMDYEVFTENELKPYENHNKERVRIYFKNNKKKFGGT